MFIDICDSTRTMETHGIKHFLKIYDALEGMAKDLQTTHSWFYKKGLGDGFMLAYVERLKAVQAALLLLEQVSRYNDTANDDYKMDIRIGADYGEVERAHDNDCFGLPVNKAARIEGLIGKAVEKDKKVKRGTPFPVKNRLLVSQAVYEDPKVNGSFQCIYLGKADLKGVDGLRNIYHIKKV